MGVVISPWNFPLAILCGMACAAVAGGNTVLLKPSNNTPVIAAELVRLCIEAGFPPGVFNLVAGRGSEVGERLIASPQIDFIAFTGSMEVGLHAPHTAFHLSAASLLRNVFRMTATGVIEEIKHLPRAEQSRVIRFALELARERQLPGDELAGLAQRLAETHDPAEAKQLRAEIHRGFYGE